MDPLPAKVLADKRDDRILYLLNNQKHAKGMTKFLYRLPLGQTGHHVRRIHRPVVLSKTLLIMKLTAILLIVTFFSSYAKGLSQHITLTGKNLTLKQVFAAIEQQTGYVVLSNEKIFKNNDPVSVQVVKYPLNEFLDKVFTGRPLNYVILDQTIVVSEKKTTALPSTPVLKEIIPEAPAPRPLLDITGKVTDEEGVPIEGASIMIAGTQTGTTANSAGVFSINANPGQTLTISAVGFESRQMKITSATKLLSITLKKVEKSEEEVVINTGLVTRRKESFTGAVTVITRKNLEKFNNNNIFSILQSIDPAFKMDENVQNGSNPNSIPEINIRGISSVGAYAVNAPLVILDGFEVSLERLYDMDVNRIETIALLKDASATSLYGSRGGNGVIVIETRLPKSGKFTATYQASPSLTLVDLSDYNLMNAAQKLEYEKLAGIYIAPMGTDIPWSHFQQEVYDYVLAQHERNVLGGVNTYWLKQPVQSTTSVAHSLRLEGGNDQVRYSLEGNYNDFKGAMKQSGRVRNGASFNLIYRIPNKFTFRNIASYQNSKEYNSPYGSFSAYTRLNPYERIYDDNGQFIIRFGELGDKYSYQNFGPTLYNPLYDAGLPFRSENNTNTISNNSSIEWFLNRHFRLNAAGILSKTLSNSESFLSPYHTSFISIAEPNRKGLYGLNNGTTTQINANANLQYSNQLGKHQVVANVIGEVRSTKTETIAHSLTGFSDDRIISPSLAMQYAANSLPQINSRPVNSASAVFSSQYSYDLKYNVTFSTRWDASSLFGEYNRNKMFWTVGARYNMEREEWFKNDFINRLSLYGNIGTSSVESFSSDMGLSTYELNGQSAYFRLNAANLISQGNPNVGWPVNQQTSVGIQLDLFKSRIRLDGSYYVRITNDMITPITVAPSMGFAGGRYVGNIGKVENKGFELKAEVNILNVKEFTWSAFVGLTQTRSKLLEISDELAKLNESLVVKDASGRIVRPSVYYQKGESLSIIRAVPSLGIDPATGRELFLDSQGDVTYTWNALDQRVVGNREQDLFGNMGTTISYKGFGLTSIFRYSIGGDIYNQTLMDKIENNSPYYNADIRVLEERWKQPGDHAKYKAINDLTVTQVSSRFVQRENFIALSSLNMYYEFPKQFIGKYHLERLRAVFSANDVFRASTVRMERGIDYPYARTYNFGVTVQF